MIETQNPALLDSGGVIDVFRSWVFPSVDSKEGTLRCKDLLETGVKI